SAITVVGLTLLLCVLGLTVSPVGLAGENQQSAQRLRYPVALAFADKGKLLLTANERSGTISFLELPAHRVVGECPVGQRLSDLVAVGGAGADSLFLCTDSATDELHLLARKGTELKPIDSLRLGAFPVSVRVDSEGRHCFVASLWSRRLT